MLHKPFVREIAGSDTVILFIHGILGTPDHFRDLVPLVPASWSIHNILLDGHGKTVDDFSKTSMEKWKRQVGDTMKDLSERYENILITAHSMGTLFALSESIKYEGKVKGLFLLAVPLKLFLKPSAPVNSMKVILNRVSEDDPAAVAARDAYSLIPSKKLWVYGRWIPRYFELFKEIRATRSRLSLVQVPCYVFQSEKDEMVSMGALKYLKTNPGFEITVLRRSRHFFYNDDDYTYLLECFQSFLNRNI